MKNRDSPCLVSLVLYFRKFSNMKRSLDHIFFTKIRDIEDKDFDAVVPSSCYVQDREVSSWFMGL